MTTPKTFKFYCLLLLGFVMAPFSVAQSISVEDFDAIVGKQDQKSALGGPAYKFITAKIPFYSVSGSAIEGDGKNTPTTESFMNKNTREILRVTISEVDADKGIIGFEIRYTAPIPVIEQMKKDLLENGYKFKKRKKEFVKKKSRKERNVVTDSKNSMYVSEFDDQPEIIFRTEKTLK